MKGISKETSLERAVSLLTLPFSFEGEEFNPKLEERASTLAAEDL